MIWGWASLTPIMAILIELTCSKFAIIDEDLEAEINAHQWSFMNGYAVRNIREEDGSRRILYMHEAVMNPPPGFIVDHRGGRTLDNRRENLRVATQRNNLKNKEKYVSNTSGFRGVHLDKKNGRWIARISVDGKKRPLGSFATPEEASKAYEAAAAEHYGEFARHLARVSEPIITKTCPRAGHARNKSGLTGICFDKRTQSWIAVIHRDKKAIFYKRFKTIEEAIEARNAELARLASPPDETP